ncbi:MAG TPA: cytochrome aa3 quinol oxidase subunit II [Bacillales bacterium]|nr:cytochrome aa3 quinol oxidase subunit II [Bacillales bacterium]
MKLKFLSLLSLFALVMVLGGCDPITVLNPEGPVAERQYHLILWSVAMMLFIVIGVFTAFTIILIRYRDRPGHKNHDPEHEGNKSLEVVWTVIPILIIIALAVPTVKAIFSLEHPAQSEQKEAMTIRVVSAQWKWIFVYPKKNIETVNYVNIPEDVPVKFKLTSAAAMTSFWVPSLGGQKYAMSGMQTELTLIADHPGTYQGKNTNFNGEKYTEMKFKVHAQTKEDFKQWAQNAQKQAPKLTEKKYIEILQPDTVEKMTYSSTHLQWVNIVKHPEYAIKHINRKPPTSND